MMKMPAINSKLKSKPLVFFEYVALIVCLSVIALRVTITEGPGAQSMSMPINLSNTAYSLSISAVLILSFLIWFTWNFCGKKFLYRFTTMEFGLIVFTIAAVIAGINAPDKRAAITDFACMLAPILMAVLLVQILDSPAKIKLVLVVIAALGVISAYQAADQLFVSNQVLVEQYENDPQSMLGSLGIQNDSFQKFLFEHRLYSRGNRAFFTTRNSAGSFFLLAFFAALALTTEKFKNRKSQNTPATPLFAHVIVTAFILFGLVITKSKGAIAGLVAAAAIFVTLLYFSDWIRNHRRSLVTICLLTFILAASILVFFGLTHDKLPGGNSMLVRWQYWIASVEMFADHPLTGVGPANFSNFYTYYKPAAALEAVADPHNFLLTIITQYGPLGLFAFIAMLIAPLYKSMAPSLNTSHSKPDSKKLTVISAIIISAVLLLIRPMLLPFIADDTPAVIIYIIFILYIIPVIVFVLTLCLLIPNPKRFPPTISNATSSAIFCAALAVLMHNLIDFAIFEPAVYTAFWAIVACLIAASYQQKPRPPVLKIKNSASNKALVLASAAIITLAYFNFALVPVTKSTEKLTLAAQAAYQNKFQIAHNLLAEAASDDPLSAAALSLNSKLYLQRYQNFEKQTDLLLKAEQCSLAAINRNRASFKNYERLTKIYNLLAQISTGETETAWLIKALDSAQLAIERYPGSARLRFELAQVAEQIEQIDFAIAQYEKTIRIEDDFRTQFKTMYPDRELISRLGNEKYQTAKKRIESLSP